MTAAILQNESSRATSDQHLCVGELNSSSTCSYGYTPRCTAQLLDYDNGAAQSTPKYKKRTPTVDYDFEITVCSR